MPALLGRRDGCDGCFATFFGIRALTYTPCGSFSFLMRFCARQSSITRYSASHRFGPATGLPDSRRPMHISISKRRVLRLWHRIPSMYDAIKRSVHGELIPGGCYLIPGIKICFRAGNRFRQTQPTSSACDGCDGCSATFLYLTSSHFNKALGSALKRRNSSRGFLSVTSVKAVKGIYKLFLFYEYQPLYTRASEQRNLILWKTNNARRNTFVQVYAGLLEPVYAST